MYYRAEAIANYLLDLGDNYSIPIEHLKLQKLLYISFGCCAVILDRHIFKDKIEAWKYGPVVPSVYYEFQSFGSKPIQSSNAHNPARAYIFDFFEDEEARIAKIDDSDARLKNCLENIFNTHKDFTSPQLVNMTHAEGTPWSKHYDGSKFKEIPKEEIEMYYKSLL